MNSQITNTSNIQTLCLTPDQMADLLIADDPNALSLASRQRHLRHCAACQAEFNQLESALTAVRQSARNAAGESYGEIAAHMRETRRAGHRAGLLLARPAGPRNRAVWALGVAAVALVVALPLTHRSAAVPSPGPAAATAGSPAAGTTITDEALLEDVDQDISASVPTSLQPLANPAGGNSSSPVSDESATAR